jgi:hypothetical protein
MARVILYERPAEVKDQESAGDIYGEVRADWPRPEHKDVVRRGDGYLERVAKYIPAEALGFVILGTSYPGIEALELATVVAVGAVGQMLWLYRKGDGLAELDKPTPRYYVLSLIAYGAWVLGTCPSVAALVGVDGSLAAIVLTSVAYLLPWIDPKTHAWLDPPPPERPLLRR